MPTDAAARRPASLPAAVVPPKLRRPVLSVEALSLLASLYFALVSSAPFWQAALDGRSWRQSSTWWFAGAVLVALVALNQLVLGLLANRWTVRPLLAGLVVVAAIAGFYTGHFGTVLDPGMLRNAMHTEFKEAADLIGWPLLRHVLLVAGPALAFLAWVRVATGATTRSATSPADRPRRSVGRLLLRRTALIGGAAVLLLGSVGFAYQDLASLFRNQREVRYLISPLNVVYSAGRALADTPELASTERQVIGADVHLGAAWSRPRRPVLLFVVVGETARAANWGLNGYGRQTTPELAALDVINYSQVTSCGSDTETSLPCMFSPFGRRHYDEKKIRSSESLLQVLARAGYAVQWRDNQTGCKGVCGNLPYQQVDVGQPDCAPGQCFDEKLLAGLEDSLRKAPEEHQVPGRVVVMHQLGNHGPAYFKRYPAAFRHFTPACENVDLRQCSVQEIVNAYDNALRYTDHVLAEAIRMLERLSDRYDTALVYASDHGESLGERGLFLHGIPYAIAPDVQTRVPMVMWLSPSLLAATRLDSGCLRAGAGQPVPHDFLFSTVLGLLDLETTVRAPSHDLTSPCRPASNEPLDAHDGSRPAPVSPLVGVPSPTTHSREAGLAAASLLAVANR